MYNQTGGTVEKAIPPVSFSPSGNLLGHGQFLPVDNIDALGQDDKTCAADDAGPQADALGGMDGYALHDGRRKSQSARHGCGR